MSNSASPLKQLLYSTASYDPFSYSVRSNAPNFARNRVRVQSTTTPAFGNEITFPIPRYGIWSSATLAFTLTVHENTSKVTEIQRMSNWLGCFLSDKITLASHNKIIQKIYSQDLLHEYTYGIDSNRRRLNGLLAGEEPDFMLLSGNRHATADTVVLDPNRRTREVTVLVPIPITFMDSTGSYLDTSFVESLNISCQLAGEGDLINTGVNKAQAPAFEYKKVELLVEFLAVPDAIRKQVQASQYSLEKPLTILSSNYFQEASKEMAVAKLTREAPYETEYFVDTIYLKDDGTLALSNLPAATGGSTAKSLQTVGQTFEVDLKCNGLVTQTYWRIVDCSDTDPTLKSPSGKWNKGKCLPPVYTDYNSQYSGGVSGVEEDGVEVTPTPGGTTVAAATSYMQRTYPGWSSYSIEASGTTVCEVKSTELLLGWGGANGRALSGMHNNSGSNATHVIGDQEAYLGSTDGWVTQCWGMQARPEGGAYDSGSMSFRELVAPKLIVTMPPYADDGRDHRYRLEVHHKTLCLNSISSSDGRITQSVSI